MLARGGQRAFVHHNLGIVLQRRGRHAAAVAAFRAAIKLDPKFGPAHLLAGSSLLQLGDVPAARPLLDGAVRLLPKTPAAHLTLANACERSGDVLCLVDRYRALVELAPDDVEYRYRLGKSWLRLAQWAHERLRVTSPESARINQALGQEYLAQDQRGPAEREFREALRRDPSLLDARVSLARLYLTDRRWEDASGELRAVLTREPAHREALALQQQLSSAAPR